ncbi:MAG: DUF3472 domain-containing protein [Prevotellaceae bacterium]|jgi:hypothetical protein|nr:DUF3472 domain-containing protein [Prevotellaceae bacterium]
MKKLLLLIAACLLAGSRMAAQSAADTSSVNIPMNGNTYVTSEQRAPRRFIGDAGVTQWSDNAVRFSSWFKVSRTGSLHVALRARTDKGAQLKVTINNQPFTLTLTNPSWATVPVGKVAITKPGYVRVDFEGVEKSGKKFADISDILVQGEAGQEPMFFVRNFETYWGNRGPSVHLAYTLPANRQVEWLYNEVTVPEGNDVQGSYYMANGFNGGYFGMQVNSATERRILFSVWSPFETDNPRAIPAEDRIVTLARGEGVHIGEFGNEGAGGQSYLIYPWKAGNTYKFLTRIRPDGKGNTEFTAYFFATDEQRWRLIASFRRPKTDCWYERPHSFLENFNPAQGYITRRVLFGNQWAVTAQGEWMPLTQGRFTYDATAAAGVRQDYRGGVEGNRFYLQNCGFFDENTPLNTRFDRPTTGDKRPDVDLKKLPEK